MGFTDVNKLRKYLNPTFVETGTGECNGIKLALYAGFQTVYSVEVNLDTYRDAVEMLGNCSNVNLYYGNSIDVLPKIVDKIETPVTFWLDSHINGRKDVSPNPCPILEEIDIVMKCKYPFVILIDDMRLFRKKRGIWGGISEQDIVNKIHFYNSQYEIAYENGYKQKDIMVVFR